MEFNERIASVRKAAGLTQEQLGELVGVSRQAVSKWESGQAVPDALTITALCQKLHVSADYLLLGVDPDTASGSAASAYTPPDTCPCCGRHVGGTICPVCGYALPTAPPRGPKYAIYSAGTISKLSEAESDLQKYCGYSEEYAKMLAGQCNSSNYASRILLRRDLPDSAAQYLAANLRDTFFDLKIVLDEGESDDTLLEKDSAMELPPSAHPEKSGLGFWGVVFAVIVALLILSIF